VHRAYIRHGIIECSCVEFGRDHVAPWRSTACSN
jgi:hypothetical protein